MPPIAPDDNHFCTEKLLAADEVEWDYAPGGVNKKMGMKFEGYAKVFTERGPHRIVRFTARFI